MKESKKVIVAAAVGTVFALTVISACGKASDAAKADGATTAKTSESVSVTNDNGSVTRSFTECNVTTNGSMVTERRRETRTTTDTAGNVLETSTSEYAQSYPVGDVGLVSLAKEAKADENAAAKADNSSFLGLEFGSVFEGTNFVKDVDEPTLLRAGYTPKKALAGFDDYYVYVTPTTHKVVKVFACAKESVDPGARGRRHYLLEALEKRYGTWARLCRRLARLRDGCRGVGRRDADRRRRRDGGDTRRGAQERGGAQDEARRRRGGRLLSWLYHSYRKKGGPSPAISHRTLKNCFQP